jgi:hypothetical protein
MAERPRSCCISLASQLRQHCTDRRTPSRAPIYTTPVQATATMAAAMSAKSEAAMWIGKASQTARTTAMYSRIKIPRAMGNFRPSITFLCTSNCWPSTVKSTCRDRREVHAASIGPHESYSDVILRLGKG